MEQSLSDNSMEARTEHHAQPSYQLELLDDQEKSLLQRKWFLEECRALQAFGEHVEELVNTSTTNTSGYSPVLHWHEL